ncbi:hypothetical protein SGRA_3087 [Saprospira grandis str. Lewin]|uniref:Uncharacterized protein n=1 Tax=Saprospira grandis (strain Lewin) TaxID=984262 RepID=H6KZN9_SAPGL|nr:hypothetical protein SGRA_3087 [Saprospira grandis str. Lewin]
MFNFLSASFIFWVPRPAWLCQAGRRYAAGLTGLFGPSAACGGFGLACGHPSAALGRSTAFFSLGLLLRPPILGDKKASLHILAPKRL